MVRAASSGWGSVHDRPRGRGFVEIHTTKPFADLATDQIRQCVLALTEARRPLLDSALSHVSHGQEQLDAWLDRTPTAREAGFLAGVTRFAIAEQRGGSRDEGPWLREALAALLGMERLEITAEETPPWYQFVNGAAEVYDSIVTQESDSEAEALTSGLRRLAALAERLIPVNFRLEDPQKTLDASRKLADLSERYGAPPVAAARRLAIDLPADSSVQGQLSIPVNTR